MPETTEPQVDPTTSGTIRNLTEAEALERFHDTMDKLAMDALTRNTPEPFTSSESFIRARRRTYENKAQAAVSDNTDTIVELATNLWVSHGGLERLNLLAQKLPEMGLHEADPLFAFAPGPAQHAEDEAQAAMSADIDAIAKRLDKGMPRLFEDMKNIQASLRRPLAF